jgi:uncharacterized protein
MKTTLVIGASIKPERYSNKAIIKLLNHQYPVIAFGNKEGKVVNSNIDTQWNSNWQVDTVTLYINPTFQKEYYQKIIDLKPNRVIFNPGTENAEFQNKLTENKIPFENACTLVLLSLGEY